MENSLQKIKERTLFIKKFFLHSCKLKSSIFIQKTVTITWLKRKIKIYTKAIMGLKLHQRTLKTQPPSTNNCREKEKRNKERYPNMLILVIEC